MIRRGVLLAALAAAFGGGCAQQEAPPGGPEDRRPPVVVRTTPEALATVDDLGMEIRFDFDERISERVAGGTLEDAVTVSPRRGEVRVSHGRTSLTVRLRGGLEPDQVYRVTLQPIVTDLFNNRMTDPFELVFSTGAEPIPTTVAGEVWGRVDGAPLRDGYVQALGEDSLVHQARTGTDGIFALRYLPAGRFTLTAFEDVNRNRELDSMEVQGTTSIEIARGDTLLVDLPVLAPDSTAAQLLRAEALDSVVVTLEFDDFLEPQAAADQISVRIGLPDGGAPGIQHLFHEHEYREWLEMVTDSLARLDSIDRSAEADEAGRRAEAIPPEAVDSIAAEADSAGAAADSVPSPGELVAPADTVVIEQAGPPRVGARPGVPAGAGGLGAPRGRTPPPALETLSGTTPGLTRDGRRLLPGRRVVLILDAPLVFDVEYELEVADVVNINGLPGGGGVDTLVMASPPPDTLPGDSAVVIDTGAVIDTGTAPGAGGAPDTGSAPAGAPRRR